MRLVLLTILAATLLGGSASVARSQAEDPGDFSADDFIYIGQAWVLSDVLDASLRRAIELFDAPTPEIESWRADVIAEGAVWHALADEAATIEPTARYEALHERSLAMYELMAEAGDDVRLSVESGELAPLQEGFEKIAEASAARREIEETLAAMMGQSTAPSP
jgi:hypothetical protein